MWTSTQYVDSAPFRKVHTSERRTESREKFTTGEGSELGGTGETTRRETPIGYGHLVRPTPTRKIHGQNLSYVKNICRPVRQSPHQGLVYLTRERRGVASGSRRLCRRLVCVPLEYKMTPP